MPLLINCELIDMGKIGWVDLSVLIWTGDDDGVMIYLLVICYVFACLSECIVGEHNVIHDYSKLLNNFDCFIMCRNKLGCIIKVFGFRLSNFSLGFVNYFH